MDLISQNFEDMLKPNVELKKFPDGDSYIHILQINECKGKDVRLFHRLYPEQDSSIVQTLFILEALRAVTKSITLIAPYLPYSRQDKIFLDGEVKSAELVCSLLSRAGVKRLITLDCHFLKKEGEAKYAGLDIKNISMNTEMLEHAKSKFGGEKFDVISPDQGANYLVKDVGGKSMKKVRGGYMGSDETYRVIESLEGDFNFKGKNVLILDDMISTGATMIKAAENVRNGEAKKIVCAATHGFFIKDCLGKLRQVADEVFSTNSMPNAVAEVNVKNVLVNVK
ncbi:MAG: ribose-phosphate diphosphokinase [Candidatus Micrarchaeota archaeon]|nr:ribose-phosphate diphosphokinase [Candidatus Micrarchaeota archaeon]